MVLATAQPAAQTASVIDGFLFSEIMLIYVSIYILGKNRIVIKVIHYS